MNTKRPRVLFPEEKAREKEAKRKRRLEAKNGAKEIPPPVFEAPKPKPCVPMDDLLIVHKETENLQMANTISEVKKTLVSAFREVSFVHFVQKTLKTLTREVGFDLDDNLRLKLERMAYDEAKELETAINGAQEKAWYGKDFNLDKAVDDMEYNIQQASLALEKSAYELAELATRMEKKRRLKEAELPLGEESEDVIIDREHLECRNGFVTGRLSVDPEYYRFVFPRLMSSWGPNRYGKVGKIREWKLKNSMQKVAEQLEKFNQNPNLYKEFTLVFVHHLDAKQKQIDTDNFLIKKPIDALTGVLIWDDNARYSHIIQVTKVDEEAFTELYVFPGHAFGTSMMRAFSSGNFTSFSPEN